jgi:hypothetical protein
MQVIVELARPREFIEHLKNALRRALVMESTYSTRTNAFEASTNLKDGAICGGKV